MTVTVHGVDGSMSEARWSELFSLVNDDVASGLRCAMTGNRAGTVAPGRASVGGVLFKSDSSVAFALDAVASSARRIDVVTAQVNWAGAGGTSSIVVVKGAAAASPIAPSVTRTAGVLWQMPLAEALVLPTGPSTLTDVRASETVDGLPGQIVMWAAPSPPTGWLLCDGRAVSRSEFAALYRVLGARYGPGDGATTFNLPDFRDRPPVGAGTLPLASSDDLAPAARADRMGHAHDHGRGTLTTTRDGEHQHPAGALGTSTHSASTANNTALQGAGDRLVGPANHDHDVTGDTGPSGAHAHDVSGATGSGGGGAHPRLTINFIIKA